MIEKTSVQLAKERILQRKNKTSTPVKHNISDVNIEKINNIKVDPRMLLSMKSGRPIDTFFSYDGGLPYATNMLAAGPPGIGKSTIILDFLSGVIENGSRGLYISSEMGRRQMYKYSQRFPQFGNIDTIFTSDYLNSNSKDIYEKAIESGYDLIVVDSIKMLLERVRDDNGWDVKKTENWLIDTCIKHNNGLNDSNTFTSHILINQVTKTTGEAVGSNKIKHLCDMSLQLARRNKRDGNGSFMKFSKNREGAAEIDMNFHVYNDKVFYGEILEYEEE